MPGVFTPGDNWSGEDLGRAGDRVNSVLAQMGTLPKDVNVTLRGQVAPMRELFGGLQLGLLAAIAVIFLLLAAYFESFRLRLESALPFRPAVAAAVLALHLTNTTSNFQPS